MNNQLAALASSAMVGMACSIFVIRTGMLPGEFGHPLKHRALSTEIHRVVSKPKDAAPSLSAPSRIRAVTHDSDVASSSEPSLSSLNLTAVGQSPAPVISPVSDAAGPAQGKPPRTPMPASESDRAADVWSEPRALAVPALLAPDQESLTPLKSAH